MTDPAAGPPDLAVVVVNFNRLEYLHRCLLSVRADLAGSGLRGEVVVVDNGSVDGSPDLVRRRFPEVRLIANRENRGFAAANNQGVAASAAPFVLLLNNDTEVLPGSLSHLVAFAAEHPEAGAVGCLLLRADGKRHRPPASILSRLAWSGERAARVGWVVGAAVLLRRAALEGVGGLDEDFFFYYEDVDLGLRLRKAGWRCWYTPGARIVHYERASTSIARTVVHPHLYRGRLLLARKHYPWAFPLVRAWQRVLRQDQSRSSSG